MQDNFSGTDEILTALKIRTEFEGSGLLRVLHDAALGWSNCFRPQCLQLKRLITLQVSQVTLPDSCEAWCDTKQTLNSSVCAVLVGTLWACCQGATAVLFSLQAAGTMRTNLALALHGRLCCCCADTSPLQALACSTQDSKFSRQAQEIAADVTMFLMTFFSEWHCSVLRSLYAWGLAVAAGCPSPALNPPDTCRHFVPLADLAATQLQLLQLIRQANANCSFTADPSGELSFTCVPEPRDREYGGC
jgi:hypothetical protein